jgi:hypothetical protein
MHDQGKLLSPALDSRRPTVEIFFTIFFANFTTFAVGLFRA